MKKINGINLGNNLVTNGSVIPFGQIVSMSDVKEIVKPNPSKRSGLYQLEFRTVDGKSYCLNYSKKRLTGYRKRFLKWLKAA